ncbi:hypothetical protein QL285_080322 [Trifolium repens]|nr:hypothetical protein QL285_080322 [Trifolium repens]
MASSSSNQSKEDTNTVKWFQTTIFPKKDKIDVCHKFVDTNQNNLDFHSPAWITNLGKGGTMVTFEQHDDKWFFIGGKFLAKANGLNKPTDVSLFYKEDNKFKMVVDDEEDFSDDGNSDNDEDNDDKRKRIRRVEDDNDANDDSGSDDV